MLDLIGVGLGPFNLSLAALTTQSNCQLSARFYERKPQFDWHPGLLLEGATLQVPFFADLVTMVDPTSRFSFLNYLKHQERLFAFYFLENFFIPRREYNAYCQWVCDQLENISFNTSVEDVEQIDGGFRVHLRSGGASAPLEQIECKNLVIGTGTAAYLPPVLEEFAAKHPEACTHSSNFMEFENAHPNIDLLVLGSGQSAAEIFSRRFHQQLDHQANPRFQLDWITRSPGFFPMEYSPLGLEHFTPDYMQLFHSLELDQKDQINRAQGLLYKGISFELIREIYQDLYHRSVDTDLSEVTLGSSSELINIHRQGGRTHCVFYHHLLNQEFTLETGAVIAATGFRQQLPCCLNHLKPLLDLDDQQRLKVSLNHEVLFKNSSTQGVPSSTPKEPISKTESTSGRLFVQNLEQHTHGVGTPDLGLGAYRAARILNALSGQEHFALSEQGAFQNFGVPRSAASKRENSLDRAFASPARRSSAC